jgi:hypothetical protein
MRRRSFLIGIGGLLTAPFVAKVEAAIAQSVAPEPIISEAEALRTLRAVPTHRGYYLTFEHDPDAIPQMTYREMLEELHDLYLPEASELTAEELEDLDAICGITAEQLDDVAPLEAFADQWFERHSPRVEAFRYLDELDLGPEDEEGDNLMGDLRFIEGEHPGSSYIAVEAPDVLTLHLLQARLLDLGEDICIRIEEAA